MRRMPIVIPQRMDDPTVTKLFERPAAGSES